MYPVVVFTDAYERAGASFRSGRFLLGEDLNWVEFRFSSIGWLNKNRTFKIGDSSIIDAKGLIINYDGEKIGKISLDKKLLSFWSADCKIFEKQFILNGIDISKKDETVFEVNFHSVAETFVLYGRNPDPLLFSFGLEKRHPSRIKTKIDNEFEISALIFYLCLMESANS